MIDNCGVDGCTNNTAALGMCWSHYRRQRKYGNPLGGKERSKNGAPKEWLQNHVHFDGLDCLIWPFSGKAKRKVGRVKTEDGYESSYRYMCLLAHGQPPEGRTHAAHSCGNGDGGCVNPGHLRWATPQENMDDKQIHGTQARGERCHNAKIDASSVRFIKMNAGKIRNRELAAKFGVHEVTIGQIISGKRWAHIDILD